MEREKDEEREKVRLNLKVNSQRSLLWVYLFRLSILLPLFHSFCLFLFYCMQYFRTVSVKVVTANKIAEKKNLKRGFSSKTFVKKVRVLCKLKTFIFFHYLKGNLLVCVCVSVCECVCNVYLPLFSQ